MKVRILVVAGPAIGRAIDIPGPQVLVIGRAADIEFSVPDDTAMSRKHARLEVTESRVSIADLDSRHGMFVNGQRSSRTQLQGRERVQVGDTVFELTIYEAAGEIATDATMASHGDTVLGATPPQASRTGARCRCGAAGSSTPDDGDDVVFFCEACQRSLAETPELPAGFSLVRALGRGAMGSVFLVRHVATGESRAIKQILPRAAMSRSMRTLFRREAAVQARLDHPHVVRVYGLEEPSPGNFSIVMDYVEGHSADHVLHDCGPLTAALVATIGAQALDGLAHAHAHDIVHRDVKEANLMLGRRADGTVRVQVADFGLAKNFQESGASGITNDGALGGTLPYMSREQLLDFKHVKPTADVYALGATLYRLLTGEYPRDYRDGDNWVRITLEQPIIPVRERVAGRAIPPALSSVIERALEPDLARRFQSATDMRDALLALHL